MNAIITPIGRARHPSDFRRTGDLELDGVVGSERADQGLGCAETLVLPVQWEPELPHRPRILLVDDDEMVLASVALVLEGDGYDVFLAGNGGEAVEQCQRHYPELVLADLSMPRRDGWSALEAIEGIRPLVPIIIITAQPFQFERAVAFGADALMEKPLDFDVLLREVSELLAETKEERRLRITGHDFTTKRLASAGEGDSCQT